MRKSSTIGLALLACVATAASDTSAQEGTISGFVVEVTDEDGQQQGGVPATLVNDGTSTSLGSTGLDGSLDIDYTDAFDPGTRIQITWIGPLETPRLLFHLPLEMPEECEDAENTASEDDDCNPIGGLIWRVTERVSISTSSGSPSVRTYDYQLPGTGGGDWSMSLTFDGSWYRHWSDIVSSAPGVTSVSTEDFRSGVGFSVEYEFVDNWRIGAGLHYNSHTFEQDFDSSNPLNPEQAIGEVNAFFNDLYFARLFSLGPVEASVPFGVSFSWNKLDLVSSYRFGDDTTTERSLESARAFGGFLFDLPVRDRLYLRAGADFTTQFDGEDADENYRVRAGVRWNF